MSRSTEQTGDDLVLSEEQARTETQTRESGRLKVRKEVDVEQVRQTVSRGTEHADVERVTALEGDSGQVETLPDGSLSIPVFEEQLVVEKRLVVRERVVVRKHTVLEDHVVTAELKRERVELETEGDVRTFGADGSPSQALDPGDGPREQ